MTHRTTRPMGWISLVTLLAAIPAAMWTTTTARAEPRKLAVLLAYPIKQDNGAAGQRPGQLDGLPNANDVYDAYFDLVKDGQPGPGGLPGPRVDSHAEWWEEISYGDVTVTGNVFGWVNLPWRTLPAAPGDLGGSAVPVGRVPHVDLDGATANYVPGRGESFSTLERKFRYDLDGVGGVGRFNNFDNESGLNATFQPKGAGARDVFGTSDVFTPGERFLDLNGNRIYDAGVFEWGIDKNHNGFIDIDKQASSFSELFGACIQLPRDEQGEPMIPDPACEGPTPPPGCPRMIANPDYLPELMLGFRGWLSDAEWFDSNGDGHWNQDQIWQLRDSMNMPIPDFDDLGHQRISQVPWQSPDPVTLPFDEDMNPNTPPSSEPWPSFVQVGGEGGGVTPQAPICTNPGGESVGTPMSMAVRFFRGDWGGTEIFDTGFDRDGNFDAGQRAAQTDEYREFRGIATNQARPATIFEFLQKTNDPDDTSVEYFDEQWNSSYDFPEPFEDYLRRWSAADHAFVMTQPDYIRNNYPGSAAAMTALVGSDNGTPANPNDDIVGRIGNHRYDGPDMWGNGGLVNRSNKLQEITSDPQDGTELAEQNRRQALSTPPPSTYLPRSGFNFQEFWMATFGTTAPPWRASIPYMRKFDPTTPVIRVIGDTEDRRFTFQASFGGPLNDGLKPNGTRYNEQDGTVLPNPADGRDGLYDGPAEYVDMPSSIYHAGGDEQFGEITSPGSDQFYGQDIGRHDPNAPTSSGDTLIPSAGPWGFNTHGNNGYDAGNQMNLEYLTWRTDGTSLTDFFITPTGGGTTVAVYHRDTNLDGLLDLGETVGVSGEFGVPDRTVLHSYGMTPYPGLPANGDPSNPYPYNRSRCMEDVVAVLDDVIDWDDFRGGPGAFGNNVMGLLLLPTGTGPNGMFTLPASGLYSIRTRDDIDDSASGLERYRFINFFDGMGIEIGGMGEGGGLESSSFQNAFAGHEYGHIWEGWPDLYDYDVRNPPPLNIVNNPVARWCVMAGGGLVHPVPVLKADSGWINPVDITRALDPEIAEQVVVHPWEFQRDKNIFVYTNPLFPAEQYWFWNASSFKPNAIAVNFDAVGPPVAPTHGLPGLGLIVMRSDRSANPEGLPPQQRIAAGRFTYQILQADGLQELENGQNTGDAGDPFAPGGDDTHPLFTRDTDPAARWGAGDPIGLDVVSIQQGVNGALNVQFRWSPRELPTYRWIQPPQRGTSGPTGVSVNGNYPLRYTAFDQFGGTRIDFFVTPAVPGITPSYNGNLLASATKAPGEIVDAAQLVHVSSLADGVYVFYARLNPGQGADGRVESEYSPPRASIENFGDGTMTVLDVNTDVSRYESWKATCINAQPTGQETWRVVGSLSGEQVNRARTGTAYISDGGAVRFLISTRVLPFRVGDEFVFVTTGLTDFSSAVLVADGEVVLPQAPDANGRVVSGSSGGLAPFTVSFKHDQSSDPFGAALTYRWSFGDGSPTASTNDPNAVIVHTFNQPRATPYQVTLEVVNVFGLSDTQTIPIAVNQAQRPTLRLDAAPRSGDVPLRVFFSADGTTDPNPGTQALDYVWDFGDGSAISTSIRTEHEYTQPGIYAARLTVTNRPYNQSASAVVEIRVGGSVDSNLPPLAQIDVDKTSGAAPFVVLFNADGSSDPEGGVLDYTWDFGDNSSIVRGASNVEHTFTRVGDYRVTLTVVDVLGQSDTATITISVTGNPNLSNQAPLARISSSSRQGIAPFTVSFNGGDSSDPEGRELSYAWNFGDGTPEAQGSIVEHTFTKPQRYLVVLRVTDAQGGVGAASVEVLVNAAAGQQSGLDVPDTSGSGNARSPFAFCAPIGLFQLAVMLAGLSGLRRAACGPRR